MAKSDAPKQSTQQASQQASHHADAVRSLAKSFRSLVALGDYLDGLGSPERATAEAETAYDAIQGKRAEYDAELAAVTAQIDTAKQLVNAATGKALTIESTATAKAAELVKVGGDQARALVANAQATIDGRAKELAALDQALTEVTAELTAARNTLASMNAQIASVKQAAAAMAGV